MLPRLGTNLRDDLMEESATTGRREKYRLMVSAEKEILRTLMESCETARQAKAILKDVAEYIDHIAKMPAPDISESE